VHLAAETVDLVAELLALVAEQSHLVAKLVALGDDGGVFGLSAFALSALLFGFGWSGGRHCFPPPTPECSASSGVGFVGAGTPPGRPRNAPGAGVHLFDFFLLDIRGGCL